MQIMELSPPMPRSLALISLCIGLSGGSHDGSEEGVCLCLFLPLAHPPSVVSPVLFRLFV